MKLRNKKTGEIKNAVDIDMYTDTVYLKVSSGEFDNETIEYHSLAELNEEWEDAPEEPKKYYYITSCGEITHRGYRLWENESIYDKNRKQIGNYFETEEEAEQAVEKLKALKRLKDKGLVIGKCVRNQTGTYSVLLSWDDVPPVRNDVDADMRLVFGGGE